MSKEIVKQRKRLGGDFAVAQAVVSRDTIQRSFCFTVDPSYKVHVCTGCGPRMARMERTTKQQPGTAGPGNMLGCCFVSFHFQWAILWPHTGRSFRIELEVN